MPQYTAVIRLQIGNTTNRVQVSSILTNILQPTEFFDWVHELRKLKLNDGTGPTEEFGAKALLQFGVKNCKTCPIAQFIVNHPRLAYTIQELRILQLSQDYNTSLLRHPLPPWANQFIYFFDAFDGKGYQNVSVSQVWSTILRLADIPWQRNP